MTAFAKRSERIVRADQVCFQKPFRIEELVSLTEQVVAERSLTAAE